MGEKREDLKEADCNVYPKEFKHKHLLRIIIYQAT